MKTKRGKVLLVHPGRPSNIRPRLPLALLYLAETLLANGYQPKIIDMRLSEYEGIDLSNAICVGVSVLTGPGILYALEFAKYIRKNNPKLPIIWGGIHPTLLPEETCQNEFVDIVVRGEGEETLLELVQCIEEQKDLAKILGITYKKDREIVSNPDRPWMNLNKIGDLPYHLVDLNQYNIKEFPYHSSRGCPHRCGFCYNLAFNKRSFRTKSADKIIDEIESIVHRFKPERITFCEDNRFTNKKIVEQICRGLIDRKIKIYWEPSCRFNYFAGYDDEFISLIKEAGVKKIGFGAESGSVKILDLIKKDITKEEIFITLNKCKTAGIVPQVSLMYGFPSEEIEDVSKSIMLIDEMHEVNPEVIVNGLLLYTSYPNTPLFHYTKKLGYKFPSSLQEWGGFMFGDIRNNPWMSKRHRIEGETASNIVRFRYFNQIKAENLLRKRRHRIPYKIFNFFYSFSAKFRWRRRFFKCPYEWKLWSYIRTKYLGTI
ncbi:MAG: radical SAM protein [Candidatus Edwardsbacteria bacterium]